MAVECPQCGRKIVSFNFNYCLYCTTPFDEATLKLIEKEKNEAGAQYPDKEFIKLQYEFAPQRREEFKLTKAVKTGAVCFLVLIACGVLYIAMKVFAFGSSREDNPIGSVFYFSAIPITIIMLALIGFMIYRVVK
ncbi:MAG: hypothetical protein A2Y62_14900 [Candidatus Fischerbacteria bacterium RBG_13_37_8]|uniref:Uncharacterized protein n=1 Tax=Candidatus Fischerbacteria bacterium RBG_13_37_8 TaxID=1817863 RepID=A0A1F5V644_9BACT|nr:MAG: hypothetical protein A2Y62_14900 [Candidatus Fischerbacteria bacterium RBG_13_37_8]